MPWWKLRLRSSRHDRARYWISSWVRRGSRFVSNIAGCAVSLRGLPAILRATALLGGPHMKFGVHLPTVRLNDPDPLAMLTEFVSESDAMGYEYLAVNDHFFNVLDPVTSLAAVAGATKHMRFIPAGLLPIHRGLVPTAKMFVTLDLFTGGRGLPCTCAPRACARPAQAPGSSPRWPPCRRTSTPLRPP